MNTRAESLARALGGHREGSGWKARCPAHEDGTPSLSIAQADGRVLVHCFAGCGQERVLAVLRERRLWSVEARPHRFTPRPPPRAEPSAWALRIWREARPGRGTPIETFLAARGLSLPDGAALRFHPGLRHRFDRGWWPAMVALVQHGGDGSAQAIHRTFLARDGRGKAPVPSPRMTFGPCRGGAVPKPWTIPLAPRDFTATFFGWTRSPRDRRVSQEQSSSDSQGQRPPSSPPTRGRTPLGCTMPETADKLVRAFMNAACDVTADDPLRGTSIDAVANRLGWVDWLQIDNVVAIAAARGWVRTSGGAKPHSISVTQTWRRERGSAALD